MSDRDEAEGPLEGFDWSSWPKAPADLRRKVLEETTTIVRRRAWRRRARVGAGWSMAYAAGLLTAWLALRQVGAVPDELRQATVRQVATNDVVRQTPSEDLDALSPAELRHRVAGASRPEQIRLLRLAGDRYLFGSADVESALDCYRQVIELTPHSELSGRDSGDSWLLAELKTSASGVDSRLPAE